MFFRLTIWLFVAASLLAACRTESTAVPATAAAAVSTALPSPPATAEPIPQQTPEPTETSHPAPTPTIETVSEPPDLRYLQAAIEEVLAPFNGVSSYVIIDLATGDRLGRNEDVAIAGMSLVKIPILINTYGVLDLPLSSEETKLISETTAQSSNFAANLLLQTIAGKPDAYAGADIVSQNMRDLGVFNTFIAVPIDAEPKPDRLNTVLTPANQRTDITTYADPFRQTTTGDVATLLAMIYACAEEDEGPLREYFGDRITSTECEDLLQKMQLNELAKLLETGLPGGAAFAHKVGWIDDTHGDGGIVFSPGGDYILVMALYDQEWLEWEFSAPLFEEVSRRAYAHFNEPGVYAGVDLPPEPTAAPQTAAPDLPHAVVTNTSGIGLTVRTTPGGEEMVIVPDGTILTLLPDPAQEVNGFTWQYVRLPDGREGWAATDYFTRVSE